MRKITSLYCFSSNAYISINNMKLKLPQIVVLLLLPAFLGLSLGSDPAFAWCFGEDGHSIVEEATITGCVDGDGQDTSKVAVKHDTPSLHSSNDKHCGPCLDFSAQQSEAVFSKSCKKHLRAPTDLISLSIFTQSFAQSVTLVVGNLAPQPPPRISQRILAHRTIVLLV